MALKVFLKTVNFDKNFKRYLSLVHKVSFGTFGAKNVRFFTSESVF